MRLPKYYRRLNLEAKICKELLDRVVTLPIFRKSDYSSAEVQLVLKRVNPLWSSSSPIRYLEVEKSFPDPLSKFLQPSEGLTEVPLETDVHPDEIPEELQPLIDNPFNVYQWRYMRDELYRMDPMNPRDKVLSLGDDLEMYPFLKWEYYLKQIRDSLALEYTGLYSETLTRDIHIHFLITPLGKFDPTEFYVYVANDVSFNLPRKEDNLKSLVI